MNVDNGAGKDLSGICGHGTRYTTTIERSFERSAGFYGMLDV